MQQTIVEVLLPLALETPYSYLVPQELKVEAGSYVLVPLGTRHVIGVVWGQAKAPLPDATKLKCIAEVFTHPPMKLLQRQFIEWLARYYLAPPGMVLRMCLRVPAALEEARERHGYLASGRLPGKMTAARRRVLDVLKQAQIALSSREIAELAGVGTSVVKGLVSEQVLDRVALPGFRRFEAPKTERPGVKLSPAQSEAARTLVELANRSTHSVTLIDGVTGSGKTEVYFEAMAATAAGGGQVLLLVPEIALTSQFIDRVEERFGARPAEWHSDLRPRERERVWRAAASGEAKILVGARSALFLPWQNLKLIVVDEEHEGAFKQEEGIPYHARDMAIVYGMLGAFPVILSSATPSLESLVNVDRGRYGRVILTDRIGRAGLPRIDIIDMREASPEPGRWISEPLVQSIASVLNDGQQALLFLNRRGYAPLTLCRACGHRIECPNCSASLVEHRFRRILLCHHCGHQESFANVCSSCHARGSLVPCGPGVERLAEEVASRFPEARATILSSDLMRGETLKETLREVKEGRFNLVIGTQLVAKGHHFPDLTLVGIVDADLALESSDPRAGERTFQLLCQVSGRAGRGDQPGAALVQTYNPDHTLMSALKRGDKDGFIAEEKQLRERALLPPFGRLAAVVISGAEAIETERFARKVAGLAPSAEGVELLGPAPAPIAVLRGRHRWRLLVRVRREVNVQAFIRGWLAAAKPKGSLKVEVDIDPYSFL
jgi:primosomal protein N' (replication factor Y) (superfamily II helicase)